MHRYSRYHNYRNFHPEKKINFDLFAPSLIGNIFICLSHASDYCTCKAYGDLYHMGEKYFCNARVAGFGEIFIQ